MKTLVVKKINLKYLKQKNKLINWLRRKIGTVSLALSNIEKGALAQTGELMSTDIQKFQRHTQGQLADSLVNGEITQEVLNLKWRTYKILKASDNVVSEITGYDDEGMPIVNSKKKNNKRGLKKVKIDGVDNYQLEMVINNNEISLSGSEAMDNEHISLLDEVMLNDDAIGQTATHGTISSENYMITNKTERPIKITRDNTPNFYLENYTKKLNVRKIRKNVKLLEFYVSKYPDEYNQNSKLFIKNINKLIQDPKQSMLEIKEIEFVTYKSMGVEDYLNFKYEIESFDKIIEFDGHYVIKFIAKQTVNGLDIFDEHKVESLELKYQNKEKK